MLRLYYFSGTGNARNVATWLASAWRAHDRDVEVVDLASSERRELHVGPDDEIGLASPTHGFNLPPITLNFVFAFPRAPNKNRAFIVTTRAGVRLFGWCLPGISGVAQLLAALVLLLKGYRIVGMRPIDLPSNWISLHPGLSDQNVRALQERCAQITQRFAEKLLNGQRDFRALWDLPQDLLIAPLSFGYYVFGRFIFAKSFIASHGCDGCGVCVKQCPIRALEWRDQRPYWTWRCESCMRCMNHCPKRAIETAHGFVILVPWAFSLGLAWFVTSIASRWLPPAALDFYARQPVHLVVNSALMIAFLMLAYRLLHRALRLRAVERVVVWSSLTHFAFWRRYRPPRAHVGAPKHDSLKPRA